jgi:hypothetical protein
MLKGELLAEQVDGETGMKCCEEFLSDEAGAVTVDWVVLTAAVVMIAMLIWPVFHPAVEDLSVAIADEVDEVRENLPSNSDSN